MVTRKTQKFYLESKASFVDISSVASFKLFAGILSFFGEYRGQLEVLALGNIHPVGEFLLQKNNVLLSHFFSSSNIFFIRLFSVNTSKKFGAHRARLREKENLFRYRA